MLPNDKGAVFAVPARDLFSAYVSAARTLGREPFERNRLAGLHAEAGLRILIHGAVAHVKGDRGVAARDGLFPRGDHDVPARFTGPAHLGNQFLDGPFVNPERDPLRRQRRVDRLDRHRLAIADRRCERLDQSRHLVLADNQVESPRRVRHDGGVFTLARRLDGNLFRPHLELTGPLLASGLFCRRGDSYGCRHCLTPDPSHSTRSPSPLPELTCPVAIWYTIDEVCKLIRGIGGDIRRQTAEQEETPWAPKDAQSSGWMWMNC